MKTWVLAVYVPPQTLIYETSFAEFAVFLLAVGEKCSFKTLKLMETRKLLEKLYYTINQGGSLASIDALYHAAKKKNKKITKGEVKRWMGSQRVYALHRPAIRNFRRNRVYAKSIDSLWELDLIDVQSLKKHNNNYKYLVTCIDVLSKYAWVLPLKDKSAGTLLETFKQILTKSGRQPKKIHTDRGSEFINKKFQSFLKQKGIGFYHTFNETKASVVERFNRTLKQRMYRYFTLKGTLKYINILQDLVKSYNNSYHRSINRTPAAVNARNEDDVWFTLYGNQPPKRGFAFNVGDKVRISKVKKTFAKGYLPNWSEEIFKISKRIPRNPPVYKLIEFDGDELEGTFYEQELQRVHTKGEEEVYKIEQIP